MTTTVFPAPAARNYASAFFDTSTGLFSRSERRRQQRCARSHPVRVRPPRPGHVRRGDILNNRYLDASTGTFLSVDPLVAKTGQAYLYGAGNPVTFSDPTGLEPNGGSQSCQVHTKCCTSGPPAGIFGGKSFSSVQVPITKRPGAGVIKIDLFIAAGMAGVPGAQDEGNDRDFDLNAPYWDSKVQVLLDLEKGTATAWAAPTCDKNGKGCQDARSWQVVSDRDARRDKGLNQLYITEDDDQVRLQLRGLNSRRSDQGLIKIPSIDDVFLLTFGEGLSSAREGDSFPSIQVSWWNSTSGDGVEVYRDRENIGAITRKPMLNQRSWGDLEGRLSLAS